MQRVGVVAPEMQMLTWFAVTVIGVAALSGEFLRWRSVDQAVAVAVICGIGWLYVRASVD